MSSAMGVEDLIVWNGGFVGVICYGCEGFDREWRIW
jgi:hypothetical protein